MYQEEERWWRERNESATCEGWRMARGRIKGARWRQVERLKGISLEDRSAAGAG